MTDLEETEVIEKLFEAQELMVINNQGYAGLAVLCSDCFGYACADCEPITYASIPKLWELYQQYGTWGTLVWCCHRRRYGPIPERVAKLKELGAWTEELEGYPRYGK